MGRIFNRVQVSHNMLIPDFWLENLVPEVSWLQCYVLCASNSICKKLSANYSLQQASDIAELFFGSS